MVRLSAERGSLSNTSCATHSHSITAPNSAAELWGTLCIVLRTKNGQFYISPKLQILCTLWLPRAIRSLRSTSLLNRALQVQNVDTFQEMPCRCRDDAPAARPNARLPFRDGQKLWWWVTAGCHHNQPPSTGNRQGANSRTRVAHILRCQTDGRSLLYQRNSEVAEIPLRFPPWGTLRPADTPTFQVCNANWNG